MGKAAKSTVARARAAGRAAILTALLVLTLHTGAALAQAGGPVPMGIIVQPEPHAFQVRIDTDADRYDRGDRVEVEFWVSRDAYVYIYNLDAAGKVSLIFPNRYDRENLVRAGTHRLPGRGYSLVVRGPDGVEYLQIIATAAPIGFYDSKALDRETFPDLGAPDSLEGRVRAQLEIVPGRQWAVDWTSYRVGRETTPPPPPIDRTGWLLVESSPSGASVYVDGSYRGYTPLTIRLDAGRYRVEVRRDGYSSETQWVRVTERDETRVRFYLEPVLAPPPAPPPPPPSLPPPSPPSPPPPSPAPPVTREYKPYFHAGFDLGLGPDPDEPGREVFSFGGDLGGPFFGIGFSIRKTGESLWEYVEVESPALVQVHDLDPLVSVEEGSESEIYGRFTVFRSGALAIRTGIGIAWQKETTVREEDYLLFKTGALDEDHMVASHGYVETHLYPTALLGAAVERGFGYVWAGYHLRRGIVMGAGFRF